MDQMRFEEVCEMEHLKGAQQRDGELAVKSVHVTLLTDNVSLSLPPGVEGYVYRVVDGVAHVNLRIRLDE